MIDDVIRRSGRVVLIAAPYRFSDKNKQRYVANAFPSSGRRRGLAPPVVSRRRPGVHRQERCFGPRGRPRLRLAG
jgi:hypothetical protein